MGTGQQGLARARSYLIYSYVINSGHSPAILSPWSPLSLAGDIHTKGSYKKSGLLMEIFHKGSAPPPLIFWSYGTGATHLILNMAILSVFWKVLFFPFFCYQNQMGSTSSKTPEKKGGGVRPLMEDFHK